MYMVPVFMFSVSYNFVWVPDVIDCMLGKF